MFWWLKSLSGSFSAWLFILRFLFSVNYSPKSSFHLSSRLTLWHTHPWTPDKDKCSPRLFSSIFSQSHKCNGQPPAALGEPVPPCWSDSLSGRKHHFQPRVPVDDQLRRERTCSRYWRIPAEGVPQMGYKWSKQQIQRLLKSSVCAKVTPARVSCDWWRERHQLLRWYRLLSSWFSSRNDASQRRGLLPFVDVPSNLFGDWPYTAPTVWVNASNRMHPEAICMSMKVYSCSWVQFLVKTCWHTSSILPYHSKVWTNFI